MKLWHIGFAFFSYAALGTIGCSLKDLQRPVTIQKPYAFPDVIDNLNHCQFASPVHKLPRH